MIVSIIVWVSFLALVGAIRVPVWNTEYSNELSYQRFRNTPQLPPPDPTRLVGESATEILWVNAKKPQTPRLKRRPLRATSIRTTMPDVSDDDFSDTSNSYRTFMLHPTSYNAFTATSTESHPNYDWIPIVPPHYQEISKATRQTYITKRPEPYPIPHAHTNIKPPVFNLTGFHSLNKPKILKPTRKWSNNRNQQNKTTTVDGLKQYLNHRNAIPLYAVSTGKPDVTDLNEHEYFTSYHENPPKTVHESPQEIPTKPIYPGEGVWAQRGQNHRPHITKNNVPVEEEEEENDEKPDGYEIFERNRDNFEGNFGDKIPKNNNGRNSPSKSNQVKKSNNQPVRSSELNNDHEKGEDSSFVPTKTYIQTRHSDEIRRNLPPVEERLKEVIKDTEIHTVYTEEGYEDEAYDHGNQHKKAEDKEHKKTKWKPRRRRRRPNLSDENSEIENQEKLKQVRQNVSSQPDRVFQQSESPKSLGKEVTRRTARTDDSREIEMEITSVVSNNGSKRQKIVKIVPVEKNYEHKRRRRAAILFAENSNNKYPYYHIPVSNLNEFSPLRYAENLSNVPKKEQGNMALYDRFKESECAETPNNINPVPEHLNNFHSKGEAGEPGKNSGAKGPRLTKLGDTIDCLKAKLFGDNPLDSPLFGEKRIEPPAPIFKEIEALREDGQNAPDRISKKINPIKSLLLKSNTTTTTPRTTVLLNKTTNKVYSSRYTKKGSAKENITGSVHSDAAQASYTNVPLFSNNTLVVLRDSNDTVPESSPLRIRLSKRKRLRRPKPYSNASYTTKRQISAITPRTPALPLDLFQTRVTVLPKYKTISEVHYKDEIKPNEQLTVFADIINNIKNNSMDSQSSSTDREKVIRIVHPPYTERNAAISVIRPPTFSRNSLKRPKYPSRKSQIRDRTQYPVTESERDHFNYDTFTSTTNVKNRVETVSSKRGIRTDANKKDEEYEVVEDAFNRDYGHRVMQRNPAKEDEVSTSYPFYNHNSIYTEEEKTTTTGPYDEVLDLTPPIPPPFPFPYKMPAGNKLLNNNFPYATQNAINRFIVPGMRPPPSSKPVSYADYPFVLHKPATRKNFHHIVRRNVFKPVYSEIRRGNNQPSNEQEEEDDYVPHRHRNYHYDVKKGKIVYNKKQPEIEEEEVEELEEPEGQVEYITLTPVVSKNIQAETSTTQRAFTTTQRNGPSFLDYVFKVKKDSTYQTILDPKDIEQEPTSTTPKPTPPPGPTTPPAFLSVISQIRSDDNYKSIPEKKTKTTTTTPEPDEEEEQLDSDDVQNSPGVQLNSDSPNDAHVDDTSDTLGVGVKSYSPRTSINYSKYKTIERSPATRRNSNTRQADEVEDEPQATERNLYVAEDRIFDETPEVPKSTTPIPTTTSTTTQAVVASSRQPIVRRRPVAKFRSTTLRPTTTATEKQTAPTVSRRGILRRRPTTTTTTTERSSKEASTEAANPNRVRFRGRIRVSSPATSASIKKRWIANRNNNTVLPQVPANHKPFYEPIKELRSYPSSKLLPIPDNRVSNSDARFIAIERPTKFDAETFKKYDRSFKHGGNYRRQSDNVDEPTITSIPPTAYTLDDNKSLERLSDIVPKPFSFYTDPGLATNVNQMLTTQSVAERHSAEVIDLTSTAKPAVIIKDPSKRLYFYAAVK